jgi:hypothetical protein
MREPRGLDATRVFYGLWQAQSPSKHASNGSMPPKIPPGFIGASETIA